MYISPLPKKEAVEDFKKDQGPISLTVCLSEVAEDCVVCDFVKPAVLKVLSPVYTAQTNPGSTRVKTNPSYVYTALF